MEQPNKKRYLKRQIVALVIIIGCAFLLGFIDYQKSRNSNVSVTDTTVQTSEVFLASDALGKLAVKDRVSKENYSRDEFGKGWQEKDGCDTRNYILQRDFESEVISNVNGCDVLKGLLKNDPYTGITINFVRGPDTSDDVQIDHIVPLSDAWQKGAQDLTLQERQQLAKCSRQKNIYQQNAPILHHIKYRQIQMLSAMIHLAYVNAKNIYTIA